MRKYLLMCLLLALPAGAQESTPTPLPAARFPYTYREDGIEIHVPNLEVTRDHRNVLVHAFLTNTKDVPASCQWQSYFTVINSKGQNVRCSSDCSEDFGNGPVITMGTFTIQPGKRVQVLIYFPIEPDEVPVRLQFSDGAVTRDTYSDR